MNSTNYNIHRTLQRSKPTSLKIFRKREGWFTIAIIALAIGVGTTVVFAIAPANGGSVGGSTTVVDNTAGDQLDPHVSGNIAAYTDQSNIDGVVIRYYDFLNPVSPNATIPGSSGHQDTLSDVNDTHIAFSRFNAVDGTRSCMVFDLATNSTIKIASASSVGATAVGGDTVAFVSSGDIMVGRISAPLAPLTNLSASAASDASPAVSPAGDVVVWASCISPGTNCSIMKATVEGGAWSAPSLVSSAPSTNPDIDGTNIVYYSNGDIIYRAVGGGAAVQLEIAGEQRNPSIAGGVIAFESSVDVSTAADLLVYQISTNTLFRLTDTPLINESLNDITVLPNGDVRLVWAADDDSAEAFVRNIYARTFTLPAVTPSHQVCLLYDPLVAKKTGTTYPIRLQLCDANGQNLSSPSIVLHAVSVTQSSTNAPGPLDDTGNANPDFDFRYDATLGGNGGYIFNLSLRGFSTGTYNLNFRAGTDPALHSARFAVK